MSRAPRVAGQDLQLESLVKRVEDLERRLRKQAAVALGSVIVTGVCAGEVDWYDGDEFTYKDLVTHDVALPERGNLVILGYGTWTATSLDVPSTTVQIVQRIKVDGTVQPAGWGEHMVSHDGSTVDDLTAVRAVLHLSTIYPVSSAGSVTVSMDGLMHWDAPDAYPSTWCETSHLIEMFVPGDPVTLDCGGGT